jgi:hypothetical protein
VPAPNVNDKEIAMRFISLYTHEDKGRPPTQEEMAKMGNLIQDGMKEGWLIATEGVQGGSIGVRIRSSGGKITVTDGPFSEAKEVIGGYALLRAKSQEEVVELTRRFLAEAGDGTCEIHALFEPPGSNE